MTSVSLGSAPGLGERIGVPARAEFSVEHERGEDEEEIEFQLKWTLNRDDADDAAADEVV